MDDALQTHDVLTGHIRRFCFASTMLYVRCVGEKMNGKCNFQEGFYSICPTLSINVDTVPAVVDDSALKSEEKGETSVNNDLDEFANVEEFDFPGQPRSPTMQLEIASNSGEKGFTNKFGSEFVNDLGNLRSPTNAGAPSIDF